MNRKRLRELAQHKNAFLLKQLEQDRQEQQEANLGYTAIGRRDIYTGLHETIFANGSINISGTKIFNASARYGSPVRATTANTGYIAKAIALDSRSATQTPIPYTKPATALITTIPDCYIGILFDTSGSMSGLLTEISFNLQDLKDLLLDAVYQGNEEALNKYVKLPQYEDIFFSGFENAVNPHVFYNGGYHPISREEFSDERWLKWLSADYRPRNNSGNLVDPTQRDRVILLVFSNEAESIYHNNPRSSNEPTPTFLEDYNNFLLTYNNRSYFKAVILSLNNLNNYVSPTLLGNARLSFEAHLQEVIDEGYQETQALRVKGCGYRLNVSASSSASQYLSLIQTLLPT